MQLQQHLGEQLNLQKHQRNQRLQQTPPTGAPPPWSAPGLSDDALEALQQLGEQVQQRLQEEKDKEERSWHRSAAKEEDLDTEPPSCEEDKAPTTAEPVEFREKTEKPEEKKEDSPLEAPDWGGSNSQEPAEEQPPEENEKRCDVDSDSEGRLATMSPKELVKSLKVSYQAAIMNLEDAQKKEKLLGVSSRASTSLMQQLQELLNQHKSRKGKKESAGLKKSQRRKRGGEENTTAITEEKAGADLFHLYRLESKKCRLVTSKGGGWGFPAEGKI